MQDRIRKEDFSLKRNTGAENPSVMLTTHVSREFLFKHISTLGLFYEKGRAESVPTIP